MHDHKALRLAPATILETVFAKAFDITFAGKDNQPHHPPPDQLGG